jgi:hypothetical protein
MIKQVMMSPAVALHHWAVNGMSIAKVLSHTGFSTTGELYDQYLEDLQNHLAALEDKFMSTEEQQHEEDVEQVWKEFGDYMREFVQPSEYLEEIDRLLPLIVATRQMHDAARSKPFRDAVRRRKACALH